MKKILNHLFAKSNVFYLFILKPLYDILISNFCPLKSSTNMNDWINPIIQIIIILLLVFVSKKFMELSFKMNVLNDVLKIRFRDTYLDGITNETKENLKKIYFGGLIEERKKVLRFLSKKYPNKKGKEISEIIDEIYPELKEFEK